MWSEKQNEKNERALITEHVLKPKSNRITSKRASSTQQWLHQAPAKVASCVGCSEMRWDEKRKRKKKRERDERREKNNTINKTNIVRNSQTAHQRRHDENRRRRQRAKLATTTRRKTLMAWRWRLSRVRMASKRATFALFVGIVSYVSYRRRRVCFMMTREKNGGDRAAHPNTSDFSNGTPPTTRRMRDCKSHTTSST